MPTHFAHACLRGLARLGVRPHRPPFRPGDRPDLPLVAHVSDPDGHRIEHLEGGLTTPQDPDD